MQTAAPAIERCSPGDIDPPAAGVSEIIGSDVALLKHHAERIRGGVLRSFIIFENRAGQSIGARAIGSDQAISRGDFTCPKRGRETTLRRRRGWRWIGDADTSH